jgi:hypothetical protein
MKIKRKTEFSGAEKRTIRRRLRKENRVRCRYFHWLDGFRVFNLDWLNFE